MTATDDRTYHHGDLNQALRMAAADLIAGWVSART